MFAGASLYPAFYKEKVNVAILLAPVACYHDTASKFAKFIANKPHRILLEKIFNHFHIWNLYPWTWWHNPTVDKICRILFDGKLCNNFRTDMDPKIDNMAREDMVLSVWPAGAGYKCRFHYI